MTDEYFLDTPTVRAFIADVRSAIAGAPSPAAACDAIRPGFAELLADPGWLPERFRLPNPESGMGGGIGQWLLFRAGDRSLTLFALIVPPGSATPIHDHLAWGLVGLYRGTQDEEIYALRGGEGHAAEGGADGAEDGRAELRERRALATGDFYALLPPRDDVHRVRTTSEETSVSIHLLTNDTGCVWRHAYDEASGEAEPFRSGYVNVACED
jgi:3-mercaptopropionate dioxygenase